MPLPQDDTLPANSQVSTSHTEAPVTELSTSEVLQKFKQLGVDAAAEEEDDDEDDEEHEPAAAGAAGPGGEAGAGGEGGKKKKKKKKGKSKASKAVDKLKCVAIRVRSGLRMTDHRNIATGGAPQELIDAVRDNMDASEQGATDGKLSFSLTQAELTTPRGHQEGFEGYRPDEDPGGPSRSGQQVQLEELGRTQGESYNPTVPTQTELY
jgi:hypothetical protein